MKKFVIFMLFSPVILFGQNFSKEIIEGLNNYMEFIHETTHAEYLFQADLMRFNSELLQKKKNPKTKVYFDNRDRLNTTTYYEQLPNDIYNKCLTFSFPITANEKAKLDAPLQSMMQNIENMQIICDSIELLRNDGVFEDTANLKIGFRLLENSKTEFYNYLLDWNKLKDEIEEIKSKYENSDMSNPYIRTAKHLDTLFDVVYDISEFARINDTIKVRELKPKLEAQIAKFEGKAEFYLEGAESFGRSNGKDPFGRFDNIINDAKAELSHTNYFLKPTKYPSYSEKIFGKPFIYYNDKYINKFNRHGIGMAYEYNKYADYSFGFVLKKAQMPHTLIVIYPEPEKKDPEPEPEKEKYTLKDAPPNNLVFLLDVSQSMNKPEKLPLLKESIKFLMSLMRDYDYVTVVTYSGNAKLVVPPTSATKKDSIGQIIDKLLSAGSTKLYPGLKLAYKSAKKSFITDGTNRIILATDGNFQIDKKMSKIVAKNAIDIQLSALYFDKQQQYFVELQKLTNIGNGNCTQITPDNIKTALVKEARGE